MPELVTIAVYAEPLRAQFARMLLEREGIEHFLAEEHLSNLRRNIDGTRLQVGAGDAETAVRLLRAEGALKSKENAWENVKLEPFPQCGGTNVTYRTAYAIIALILCLPFWGKRYQCGTCGHCWK